MAVTSGRPVRRASRKAIHVNARSPTAWSPDAAVLTVTLVNSARLSRVASSLVEIVRRDRPIVDAPFAPMFAIIRQGFATRRKMLRRALDGVVTAADFAEAGVNPEARAEELTLDEWSRLTLAVTKRRGTPA